MHATKIAGIRFALAAAGAALVVSLLPAPARAAGDDAAKKGASKEKMPSYPALMKMKPADAMHMMDTDKSGYVTREEFLKFYEALFERLDRDKNQQVAAPEFTDAG